MNKRSTLAYYNFVAYSFVFEFMIVSKIKAKYAIVTIVSNTK